MPKSARTARVEAVRMTTSQRESARQEVERRRHQERDRLGEAQGQGLGHQLAQDQLDVDDAAADQDGGRERRA